eukprot:scaffold574497_cov102-Attheya_sp.AAC.1
MTFSWLGDCCLSFVTSDSPFFELNETSTVDETNCLFGVQFHNPSMQENIHEVLITIEMNGHVPAV